MEQEQAVVAESEAAPREEEVVPEGTAEAETGGIVLEEELERQGPALTNETLRDWVERWCSGKKKGLPPISTWNTSQVTDFSKLFMNQKDFNDDISAWDTSRVTTMEYLFRKASSFNQPLNDWRGDNVTDMSRMFAQAYSFNQPLNDWRVDNVTDMGGMFYNASSFKFNHPMDWRLDNVRTVSRVAAAFSGEAMPEAAPETAKMVKYLTNEELRDWKRRWCDGDHEGLPHISTWNTSEVTDMSWLFHGEHTFNDDISAWDTSNVTNMRNMFWKAKSFNRPLSNWRVDNVTRMDWMFNGASAFNQPLNDWRVDNFTPSPTPGGCCAIS